MAIRPKNLTPRPAVRNPDDNNQVFGNIVNSPRVPQFGGAAAVSRIAKRTPYGRIAHVGRRGRMGNI